MNAQEEKRRKNTTAAPLQQKRNEWRAPKPNEWKSIAPMASDRECHLGLCVNDHQFLVIEDNASEIAWCEYYDTRTRAWRDLPIIADLVSAMAESVYNLRYWFGIARVKNRIFLMNTHPNQDPDFRSINVPDCDLSKVKSGDWKKLVPMKYARFDYACVSHSNHIYVFGGHDFKDWNPPFIAPERYDTETNKWTTLPNMPGGDRCACVAAVVGDKIYVVGGQSKTDIYSSVLVFDTAKQQWEPSSIDNNKNSSVGFESSTSNTAPIIVPDMNTLRFGMAVTAVDKFLIVIGGDPEVLPIEVLDTWTNSWNRAKSKIDHGRLKPVIGFLKETNEIILAGGSTVGADAQPQTNAILTDGLLEITRKRVLRYRVGATAGTLASLEPPSKKPRNCE